MIKLKKTILTIFLVLFYTIRLIAINDYGLYLKSYSVPANERTSLILNDNAPFKIKDNFVVDFQMQIRENSAFGTILNIRDNNGIDFKFIFSVDENGKNYPAVIYNDEIHKINTKIITDKWIHLSIYYNKYENFIQIVYDNIITKIPANLNEVKDVKIIFGANTYADIAPVNIKDIKITENNLITRYWKLSRHNGNICYDEIHKIPAVCKNPLWLIDNHLEWQKVYSESDRLLNVAFDNKESNFYIINETQIKILSANSGRITRTIPIQYNSVLKYPGHLLFDSLTNSLCSYSLDYKTCMFYSLEKNKWSNEERQLGEPGHYNHGRAFSSNDSSYYFFGGYGFYKYRNELFKLNPASGKISVVDYSPKIPPRFSPAMAVVGNKLYIFGGKGNDSGKQELERKNYHDLYEIDLKTGVSKKLWENNSAKTISIMASSMFFEPSDSSFYAVSMDKNGILWNFSIKDTTITEISRPIKDETVFQDIDFSLYSSSKTNKLFLVMDKITSSHKHELTIYSIHKPFLDEKDTLQIIDSSDTHTDSNILWYTVVIILTAAIILFYQKFRLKTKAIDNNVTESTYSFNYPPIVYFNREKSSISLLGTFGIKDKNGNDITQLFTPKLKGLLIIIILYTEKTSKGVPIKKVLETIWPNKDEVSARNNLNVNLRKLRVLLENVGDLEIVNEAGFIHINWGNNTLCDYHTIISIIKQIKDDKINNKGLFDKALELLLFGPLLNNTRDEWLDEFKEYYSNMSIDLLNEILLSQGNNTEMALHITDIIFLHDPLSEEALAIKCSILFSQGKKGLAMNVYNRFCKEYKNSLGEDYKKSISDLLKDLKFK